MLRYTFTPSNIQSGAFSGFFIRGANGTLNGMRDQTSAGMLESPNVRFKAWRSRGFRRTWQMVEHGNVPKPLPVSSQQPIQVFTPGNISGADAILLPTG